MKSTIKLFKALPIKVKRRKKASENLLKETIKRGFIFAPEVVYNYSESELLKLIDSVGITAEQINNSFHKSWQKIKEADLEQLVVEQLAHYLTTYGKEQPKEYLIEKEEQWGVDNLAEKIITLGDFESDRIQDADYVYIPKEILEIPEFEGINLMIIKGYTKKELKTKLLNLLQLGIALSEDTINDVVDTATFVELNEQEVDNVKNKEVRVALCDYLNLFPENPVEFLRYVVYKATNKTLLIKDSATIEEINSKKNLDILNLFIKYKDKYGLKRLAEIFYRFKPLFLAFKTNKKLSSYINKIRKLAIKYHKPLPEDYLNEITAKIKKGEKIDVKRLKDELNKVNVFRKIRLAYALQFRIKDVDSILYRIRNGKGYATEFSFSKKNQARRILNIVLGSIAKSINVKGKKIYIPKHINYALPATEKQFTGYFSSGTYVSIPKDMIIGIYWENTNGHRVDLDLSLFSPDTGKIGWDAGYRTEDRGILFSGDVTDAPKPNGATELFYIKRQTKNALILFVNYYNFNSEVEVPFKIIVAKEQMSNFRKNYMVNPNNVVAIAESKINQKQKILGLLITTTNESRFYFAETYLGGSITSTDSDFAENSRKYLFNFYENTIGLNNILQKAGAKIVNDKEECDIDLSPERLEKDSILNLLQSKPN